MAIVRSASEVSQTITEFLDDSSGRWDWDDFTSIPITDPALEAIRAEAASIYPREDRARDELERLLARARDGGAIMTQPE